MPDQTAPATDLKSLIVKWVVGHFGTRGIVLLAIATAIATAWWNWDKLRTLPGIAYFVNKRAKRSQKLASLPTPDAGRFAVAEAHLENDTKPEQEDLVVASISESGAAQTLRFDRTITQQGANVEQDIKAGHEQARHLLAESGADVLIWGRVLRSGDKAIPQLRWTASRKLPLEDRSRRYTVTEQLELPQLFLDDLTDMLDLLVLTNGDFVSPSEVYTRGPIPAFIERVDRLLLSESAKWPREVGSELSLAFADLCLVYSAKDWKNDEWLKKAEGAYLRGLPQPHEDWMPRGYVHALFNLAQTYSSRGIHLPDSAQLKKAIPLFRAVATLCSDGRDNWLESYANLQLGHTLRLVGEEEADAATLQQALDAYADAAYGLDQTHQTELYVSMLFGRAETLQLVARQEQGITSLQAAVSCYEQLVEFNNDTVLQAELERLLNETRAELGRRAQRTEG